MQDHQINLEKSAEIYRNIFIEIIFIFSSKYRFATYIYKCIEIVFLCISKENSKNKINKNTIHDSVKKNKIFRNRFNKKYGSLLHLKLQKTAEKT